MKNKKLGISENWLSRSVNPSIIHEQWIRNCINGIFNKFQIITSNIYIHSYPNYTIVIFSIYDLIINNDKQIKNRCRIIIYCIKLIESLCLLKFNINVKCSVQLLPSLLYDSHALASWIKLKLEDDPLKFRSLFLNIIKLYK